MPKKYSLPRFDRLLWGLQLLNDYRPVTVDLSPIPASFPNGAPNHSYSAYLSVELENWPVNEPDGKRLKELGWKEEQEGLYWIFQ